MRTASDLLPASRCNRVYIIRGSSTSTTWARARQSSELLLDFAAWNGT